MTDRKVIPLRPQRTSRGRTVAVGGSVDETKLTLAVYGDFDPAAITHQLGVEPTETLRKGERRNPRYRPNPQSAWFLTFVAEAPRGLEELLADLLARVASVDATVWRDLRAAHDVQLRIGIFMNAWNRGFTVPSDLIAKAAYIVNHFNFDIYASGDE